MEVKIQRANLVVLGMSLNMLLDAIEINKMLIHLNNDEMDLPTNSHTRDKITRCWDCRRDFRASGE